MMKLNLYCSLIFVLSATSVFAKGLSDQQQAEKILETYNNKSGVQIELKIVTEKKALGTKTQDKGTITYQGGRMNLSVEGEKKSEMIFDGARAYLISYPDHDLDPNGKRKVATFNSQNKNQLTVLTSLLGNAKKFFANFKVKTLESSDKQLSLQLEDKNKILRPMVIDFDKGDQKLTALTYKDEVDTETQITFSNRTFPKKLATNLFKYVPQKDDESVSQ